MKKILEIDANSYQQHLIHGEGRDWAETNCYVDLWVELLHALGHEPIAALPFTLGIDFEGDQWTFFKFGLADLDRLYGLNIQELSIWRDLILCIEEQVALGRPVLVELDSFFLPDTQGTAYKLEHVKTTVAVNELDIANRHLGYFHNQGYYVLNGQDFTDIFLLEGPVDPRVLPPYVEYVKFRDRSALKGGDLLEASLDLLKYQLTNLPKKNPFAEFKQRFAKDLEWLMSIETAVDMQAFHKYSFATLRQYGACFELCKTYLQWLAKSPQGQTGLDPAIEAFGEISNAAKVFQFQLARALARKREMDLAPIDTMGNHWQRALSLLTDKYA